MSDRMKPLCQGHILWSSMSKPLLSVSAGPWSVIVCKETCLSEGCAMQAEQAAPQPMQRTEEQLRHALQSIKV